MAALGTIIVPQANAIQYARLIGVCQVGPIVGLDIRAKSISTVLIIVQILLVCNHPWGIISRDSMSRREKIQLFG